ncbi:hypothetical protein DPMN_064284 [Dreissena polymorpha]|uniref:Uncharacterized protein n=1 Tax=Dreissena polymorpha TaxID=45954 RepID=A0A9D4CBZ4_DREPO|nr:hypothetical protein DPMN_064284 [Dreissena polymorpha]
MASGSSNVESGSYKEEQKVYFHEILPIRELLHKKEYLLHPMDQKEHRSLNGDKQNHCG